MVLQFKEHKYKRIFFLNIFKQNIFPNFVLVRILSGQRINKVYTVNKKVEGKSIIIDLYLNRCFKEIKPIYF